MKMITSQVHRFDAFKINNQEFPETRARSEPKNVDDFKRDDGNNRAHIFVIFVAILFEYIEFCSKYSLKRKRKIPSSSK